jgi:CO/xanthine dehydrogenase FAD-binding subunit
MQTHFNYVRPTEWATAIDLLAQPGAVAKMGGCDVLTRHRRGKLDATILIGLNDLPDGARIGAAVTLARLERDSEFRRRWPALGDAVASIGSPSLRTSATAVGNVAQGWSVGDLVPLLQACDGSLAIVGKSGSKQLSVSDYAAKPKNGSLQRGEIISRIDLPYRPDFRLAFERFSFKEGFDLPLVAAAVGASVCMGQLRDVRIALVGAGSMPARCVQAESVLEASAVGELDIEACVGVATDWATPHADHIASAEYRRHVLAVILRRALKKFASVCKENMNVSI